MAGAETGRRAQGHTGCRWLAAALAAALLSGSCQRAGEPEETTVLQGEATIALSSPAFEDGVRDSPLVAELRADIERVGKFP